MKYIANPIEVEAFKITEVGQHHQGRGLALTIDRERDSIVFATGAMTARINPKVGDYWVVQSDGYIYVNPKDVFERKYSPEQSVVTLSDALEESVKLQSHYAELLNMHDGGERIGFANAAAWIERLTSIKKESHGQTNNSR